MDIMNVKRHVNVKISLLILITLSKQHLFGEVVRLKKIIISRHQRVDPVDMLFTES